MSEPLAAAEAAIRTGDPAAALASLTAAVRGKPADPKLRVFLAQLLCVLGQWERAHTQLNVVADLDPQTANMREMVGHALRCEVLRKAVFDGRRTPMVFGQPDQWLALLIESLLQLGGGDTAQAADLARRAFDDAPATSGQINGEPFEWIADADSRLGPVLEAAINGRYYWVPFSRISTISFEAPTDLRDNVWLPAQVTFANGGEVIAMVPTRYPGSEASADGLIQLARKTEWTDAGNDRFFGLGQRVLVTDQGEHDLLSVRLIELQPVASGDDASEASADG